ncbi:MAG: tryptophan synthase subunit alpha [Ignavibacteria bacterium]|jgi:tryptophan synthase alpha chain|nr:tryptophan synthase subunit alpha [Ignavibacteria bacterium]MCU7505151.1 tryptophan synthase subunit alpha [Ignavibacteria bacterium]MCU7517996.1 tryptophan synthase subunit alpha [Ignavibacteria bacterium]
MNLSQYIDDVNKKEEKALSVFLTAGFPFKDIFADTALSVLDSGADLLELGIPFSDPLADGPVIQHSSQVALENKVNIKSVLEYTSKIKSKTSKPVVLMGYANPVLNYGREKFFSDAADAGADGVIIPDVPIDEYDEFYESNRGLLDTVMLTTPFSSAERIRKADELSRGFVYCVSIYGTTGQRTSFSKETLQAIEETRKMIKKNKMMIGFGISSPESIRSIAPFCDGVIVGSAIIKKLFELDKGKGLSEIADYVKDLKEACMEG